MIRISIIIPFLNSHELVRRQLLHFQKMGLPDDVELIIVDDGSDPPLKFPEFEKTIPSLRFIYTNDKRPWTSSLARNKAAPQAKGEYIIFADGDHIITKAIIELVRKFTDTGGDFVRFNRAFAVLDENGDITQDPEELIRYGLPRARVEESGTYLNVQRNQYATRKDFFINVMKGYNETLILTKPYPQREDGDFSKRWNRLHESGKIRDFDDMVGYEQRETILMIPNGKFCEGGDVDSDPMKLMHTLTRKTRRNPYYIRP